MLDPHPRVRRQRARALERHLHVGAQVEHDLEPLLLHQALDVALR